MKQNKKNIIFVNITFITLIIIIIFLIIFINNKNQIYCEIKTDKVISKIDIKKKNMTINNEYNFDNMDETVDKYDETKIYIDMISKIDGVEANITQNPYYMDYTINIDLSNINEKDYELLGIKDIIKLDNKKDIINYYAKKGYKCY